MTAKQDFYLTFPDTWTVFFFEKGQEVKFNYKNITEKNLCITNQIKKYIA